VGWPRALREEEKPFLHPSVRELPGTGLLTGRGGEVNLEVVLKNKPDLILDIGSTAPVYVDLANRLERQTGIPTALLSGRFEDSAHTLQKLGVLLGQERRASELATYTTKLLEDAKVFSQSIGIQERPLVYLARGADGLETATPGSINAEIIERAGGMNVLNALGPAPRSIVRVSMETIYRLNPEVIITWDKAFYQQIFQSPRWQSISAVVTKRVYLAPLLPFGWIDRPPSINRLIGIPWLQAKLFPGRSRGDLHDETGKFFRLFYGVELTSKQLDELLGPA
jgi:iron complex transport system substrate-binding protein